MKNLTLLIALPLAACNPPPTTTDAPEEAVPTEPVNAPSMSQAEFTQLTTGMNYDEAVEVIGGPGELISENDIGGFKNSMYQWEGEGSLGANANAMFQNGKLIQKSQFGLE